jgi:DNA-binding winged helix-turn-helix (wHTH) protein
MIEFPPFALDLRAQLVRRGERVVPLRPKTWAVLQYLALRPGALVPKEELIAEVWGNVALSDDAITRTVGELRHALDDDARNPRIVETVHGRGFRFIAPLPNTIDQAANELDLSAGIAPLDMPPLIGRDTELSTLRAAFRRAAAGSRQLVLISGEPGVGKTGLVNRFIHELRDSHASVRIGWGQCLEQYGGRESYMPVLEAVERLSRGRGVALVPLLRTIAPSWLLQMPSLQKADDAEALAGITSAATPQRMLREFAGFMEAASSHEPIVIVLEDLHWSDCATIDLLSMLAQRTERARMLVIATYRPADAVVSSHPIVHAAATLHQHRLCTSLELHGLSRADVAEYVKVRLGSTRVSDEITALVYEQTNGIPLLIMGLMDQLIRRGWLVHGDEWTLLGDRADIARDAPDDLVRIIEAQMRLMEPAERELLEVAAIAGEVFDTQLLAAGLNQWLDEIESHCDRLRRAYGLFRHLGIREWPDMSVGGRYRFVHATYQRAIYGMVPTFRQRALHRRLAERLESGFAGATRAVAGEIAVHFQRSGNDRAALTYLAESARRSYEQRACEDTIASAELALRLAEKMPPSTEMANWELQLRQIYGAALSYTRGYCAPSLKDNLVRALELAQRIGDSVARFEMLYALEMVYSGHGDDLASAESCRQLLEISSDVPSLKMRAQLSAGRLALWRGDLAAAEQFLRNSRLETTGRREAPAFGVQPDFAVLSHESLLLWVLGDAVGGWALQHETIEQAERFGHLQTTAQTLIFGAIIDILDERWTEGAELSSRALMIARENEFPLWTAIALTYHGLAIAGSGRPEQGLRDTREGLALLQYLGFRRTVTLALALQASVHLTLEDCDAGLKAVDRGLDLCCHTAERLFESELWRLKGEHLFLRARGRLRHLEANRNEAQACLRTAFDIATAQGARSLQRRAHRSLSVMRGSQPAARHRTRVAGVAQTRHDEAALVRRRR